MGPPRFAGTTTRNLNAKFSDGSSRRDQNLSCIIRHAPGGDDMERRHFLKFAVGLAAGAAALAASAQAAPLAPHLLEESGRLPPDVSPAVTTKDEVDHLKPEQVRWGHHWHRHWHRRHWGWHRRWHRRHWRRWHRRYW
jgi:hypothetical protein